MALMRVDSESVDRHVVTRLSSRDMAQFGQTFAHSLTIQFDTRHRASCVTVEQLPMHIPANCPIPRCVVEPRPKPQAEPSSQLSWLGSTRARPLLNEGLVPVGRGEIRGARG